MVRTGIPTGEAEGKRTGRCRERRAGLHAEKTCPACPCSSFVVKLHDARIRNGCGQRSGGEAEVRTGTGSVQRHASTTNRIDEERTPGRERLCELCPARADHVLNTGEVTAGIGCEAAGKGYRTIRIEAGERVRVGDARLHRARTVSACRLVVSRGDPDSGSAIRGWRGEDSLSGNRVLTVHHLDSEAVGAGESFGWGSRYGSAGTQTKPRGYLAEAGRDTP